MKSQLFMRKEKNALDLFAAFMNVSSMDATEKNFGKLRKDIERAEKRLLKELKMKRMKGVSVGVHPYFRKRGSYDGEKMLVALRLMFTKEGMEHYRDVVKFAKRLGFKDKAMAVMASELVRIAKELTARGTNPRGTIEELEVSRPQNLTQDLREVVDFDVKVPLTVKKVEMSSRVSSAFIKGLKGER